jgi:hypothetical protein
MADDDGEAAGKFADLLDPAGTYGRPVAATVEDAAELLGLPLRRVRQAAERVEPYRHADGSGRWSLRELEREVGRRRRGGTPWRAENRATYRRDHGADG